MHRIAKCSCENLQVELTGNPLFVVACSCLNCQKRTGSVFGVSAYFESDQIVKVTGESKPYTDWSEEGRTLTRRFCPTCGTTVYWEAEFKPDAVGVAVGCFTDPKFPEPVSSVWNRSKHDWVSFPEHWRKSDTQSFDKAG